MKTTKKMELYDEASRLLDSCSGERGHVQTANRNGWLGGFREACVEKDAAYDRAQGLLAEWRKANGIKRYGEK